MRFLLGNKAILVPVSIVQAICAIFFVSEIFLTLLGVFDDPIDWQTRELLEIGAAVGLILGLGFSFLTIRSTLKRSERAEASLQTLRSAFQDHLNKRFDHWGLTAAERDVALFTVKGMSVSEISELRGTSEGTIKSQSARVNHKAGVRSRTQFLSLLLDDLLTK